MNEWLVNSFRKSLSLNLVRENKFLQNFNLTKDNSLLLQIFT